MLITVSGMVGSGKTTAAARIVRILQQHGVPASHVRFQTLPCFTLFKGRGRTLVKPETRGRPPRWSGYRRKRLTARLALGYAVRMFMFRAFQWRNRPRHAQVMDRYFYDNFVHFQLRARSERVYAAVLQRLIPRPDLSILLTVTPETAAARSPDYSPEYLQSVAGGYEVLRARFGGLVEIQTDASGSADAALDAAIADRLSGSIPAPETP